jgi:hypothetical protein
VESDDAYAFEGDGRPIDCGGRLGEGVVLRSDTLNAMATGEKTITVAGYRRSDGEPAPYSSCGRIRGNANRIPDVAAPCEEGTTHVGILGAGPRSGAAVALRGTSFAAPQVGRWIADNHRAASNARLDEQVTTAEALVKALRDQAKVDEDNLWPPAEADKEKRAPEFLNARRGFGRMTSLPTEAAHPPRREAAIEFD